MKQITIFLESDFKVSSKTDFKHKQMIYWQQIIIKS